jgi:hypothetical protein
MKRIILIALPIALLTTTCTLFPPIANLTNLQEASSAIPPSPLESLPPPGILVKTPLDTLIPATENSQLEASLTPTLETTSINTTEIPAVGLGSQAQCGAAFIAQVSKPPEMTKDLFEHHAHGIFLIVILEMQNITEQPIQIWDGDYSLEGIVDNKTQVYTPQKAATGYLFITRGNSLNQDQIKPGITWRTYLAFDVNPTGKDWKLVVKPGYEINQQICEIKIALTQ